MTTVLFVTAVVAVALVCPAMMWWQARRGKAAACCLPSSPASASDLEALRQRHQELQAEIDRRASGEGITDTTAGVR